MWLGRRWGSAFLPIADYGFLSDCEVSALVAPSGNVEWMCLPRMDGPSVFAAMLDRGAVQTLIAGRHPPERAAELILGRPTGIKTVIAFEGATG